MTDEFEDWRQGHRDIATRFDDYANQLDEIAEKAKTVMDDADDIASAEPSDFYDPAPQDRPCVDEIAELTKLLTALRHLTNQLRNDLRKVM